MKKIKCDNPGCNVSFKRFESTWAVWKSKEKFESIEAFISGHKAVFVCSDKCQAELKEPATIFREKYGHDISDEY